METIPLPGSEIRTRRRMSKPVRHMDILFAATELAPLAEWAAGVDATSALSKSLRQLDHKVTLVMPRFPPLLYVGGLSVAAGLRRSYFPWARLGRGDRLSYGRLGIGVEPALFDVPGLYDHGGGLRERAASGIPRTPSVLVFPRGGGARAPACAGRLTVRCGSTRTTGRLLSCPCTCAKGNGPAASRPRWS